MEPLQRKNVLCKILSLILTQRVLTLQEMHRYFIVYEYLTTTQKKRRHLLYLSRMVQQRGFWQRNRHRVWAWPRPQNWFRLLLANRDMDLLWKMHFRVTRPTFNALCDFVRGVPKLRGVSPAIHFDFFFGLILVHGKMFICRGTTARGFQLVSLFLLVKYVLKCGVGHTWRRTSASLNYERFHGH